MMIQDVKVVVGVGTKKLPLMALELEMNEWLQESDGRDGWRRDGSVGE